MDERATIADLERRLAAAEAALREQADVEAELRRSEELRRLAVEGGRMGTWRWNLRDELVWGDAAFLALWGFPPSREAYPLSDFADRISPQDRALVGEIIAQALAANREFDGLIAIQTGPAKGRWVRWRGRAEREQPWIVNGVSFDVTDQQLADERLRANEVRQTFLLQLSDALRALSDPEAVGAVATQMLARHMEVSRCHVIRISRVQGLGWLGPEHHAPDLPDLAGEYRFSDFPASMHRLETGPLIIHDLWNDASLSPADKQSIAAMGMQAALTCALNKGARDTIWALNVGTEKSRTWTDQDQLLVQETAERTWAAIERAHSETRLRESEDRLARALEGGEVGAWELDLVTLQAWRSPQHDRIFGYATLLPEWTYDMFLDHVAPEDRGVVDARFQDAIAGRGRWIIECRIQRVDGALRWIGAQGQIDGGAGGQLRRMKGTVRDITERKWAEIALRASEERFAQFAASSSDALWIRDAATLAMEYVSPAAQAIYGVQPEAILGEVERWAELIETEDRAAAQAQLELARNGEPTASEFRVRRPSDGSLRWIKNTDFPLYDEHGQVQRVGGIAVDITEVKRAAGRQVVLINELQHRARNLLAVIRSIADRTVKQGGSVEAFEVRLQALSRAQGLLSQAGSDQVEVGALVRAELAAHADGACERTTISGQEVYLTSQQVQNFALALHELTTNAIKYGALKDGTGYLAVTWEVVLDHRERRRLALSWVESGVDVEMEKVTRRGYGTELIQEALAYALHATVEYELGTDGVRCRIEMPVS